MLREGEYLLGSLEDGRALTGSLIARHVRRDLMVDYANQTFSVPVQQVSVKRARWPYALVIPVLIAVLALLVVPRGPQAKPEPVCSEQIKVGEFIQVPVSSKALGGVTVFDTIAQCSKNKLRVTVETATRRVLSVTRD